MSSGDLIGDAILGTIFVVDLHSGTNLLARDSNGLSGGVEVLVVGSTPRALPLSLLFVSDPYVIVRIVPTGSSWDSQWEWKSKVVPKTLNPKWNDAFMIRFDGEDVKGNFPVTIHLKCLDKDFLSSDHLGHAEFRLNSLNDELLGKRVSVPLNSHGEKNGGVIDLTVSLIDF